MCACRWSPTIWGEKTVLRLLDKSRALMKLSDLGMQPATHELYSKLARSPFGMLIVSGPTGSGKTTTLYATLSEINPRRAQRDDDRRSRRIRDARRSTSCRSTSRRSVTFANGLKSILRQDPDVILVGEMRDLETARIAVQSALTGHLVLSSLHATDTIAAFYRLLNMGIETFAVASAIVGMVAQRLVRRMCTDCQVVYDPSPEEAMFYDTFGGEEKALFREGQRLRQVLRHRLLRPHRHLRGSAHQRQDPSSPGGKGVTPNELRDLAVGNGLRTLAQQAMRACRHATSPRSTRCSAPCTSPKAEPCDRLS